MLVEENKAEGSGSKQKSAAEHATLANRVHKRLKKELEDAAPEDLDDENIVSLRNRLVHECEKAMSDATFRENMFSMLWTNAFYSTVYVYRSHFKANQCLSDQEKKNLADFVKKTGGYLLKLMRLFPDLEFKIFMCIGDLHRYCTDMNVEEDVHLKESLKFYARALALNPEAGHPLNQLGVLYKEKNPWKAACMFCRSYLAPESYAKAEENFNLLKETGFTNDLRELTWDYVFNMFEPFNRILLDGFKSKWMEKLQHVLDEENVDYNKILESFEFVLLGFVMALSLDRENSEKLRYLLHSVCEDIKFLLKEMSSCESPSRCDASGDKLKNKIKKMRANRRIRRRKSDSSDSDEGSNNLLPTDLFSDDEAGSGNEREATQSKTESVQVDLMLPFLSMCIEWCTQIDKVINDKKLSVGLRMDFQAVVQQLVDVINKYIDDITVYVGEKNSSKIVWALKAPGTNLPENFFHQLIADLMQAAEKWALFPVYFDLYYKFLAKNQDLQAMRAMAELRLAAAEHDVQITKEIPKFVLFEAEAIRLRLHILRSVVKSKQAQVLVTKATMRKFDANKTKDADVRSAIRYLEEATKTNDVTLVQSNETRSSNVAREFLADCGSEDGDLLILCGDKKVKTELGPFQSHKMYLEGVDNFFQGFSSSKRLGAT